MTSPVDRVSVIYAEPAALGLPRGQEILARFPDAEVREVASSWRIPELHGDERNVERWVRIKRSALVLGVLKSPRIRPNGRSADFIAPSLSNGCAMACAYCYVPRRKGFSNPITIYANVEQILRTTERHALRQGPKTLPNQCDPDLWVYDLGENGDSSVDATLSDNVKDAVELFGRLPHAKASFATKFVNRDLLGYDHRGHTRVRFSLMPAELGRRLDVRTSPMAQRIAAIDDFVAAGYEVHVNLSPVVIYPGWEDAWAELLRQLGDGTSARSREQLAAEVIFLTHNEPLHEVNLGWHPSAEEVLWRPDLQETKRSESGQINVRYRTGLKGRAVATLRELIAEHAPYLRVRYAF